LEVRLIRKRIKLIFLVTVAVIILSGTSIYIYLSVLDELNKCLINAFKSLEIASVEITDLTYNPSHVKFNISLMLKNSAGYDITVKSIRGKVFVNSSFVGRINPLGSITSFKIPANTSYVISFICTNSNPNVIQTVNADDYTMYINGTIVGYASYYFITAERVENFSILYKKAE